MTIVLFFVVLFALILVHEWGHFIAAKKTGMRVDEFGIGFPPKLFGVKHGETEYTFNLLPIGGFVRIYGENAADAAEDGAAGRDISRSFTAKSKVAQAIVLVAGVVMNILFAWILFTVAFTVGVPTAIEEANAPADAVVVIESVLPESAAALAGIPPRATITEVKTPAGEVLTPLLPSSFRALTETSAGLPITVTYQVGDGEPVTTTVTPAVIQDGGVERAAIGVRTALIGETSYPLHEAAVAAATRTGELLWLITVGITTLIADSFAGTADYSAVTGPVGIVGMVGDAASFGFTALLTFTAIISLNLAVINLLPFPALDGGRLVFVGLEAVLRRPINPVWMARINAVGFILLLALMVAVTYKDIVAPR